VPSVHLYTVVTGVVTIFSDSCFAIWTQNQNQVFSSKAIQCRTDSMIHSGYCQLSLNPFALLIWLSSAPRDIENESSPTRRHE
jgi:hypothetical protein